MKILIFGLPGSGKTTLATYLIDLLGEDTVWYNADEVRKANNDWDFTDEGRLRQAERMRDLMNEADELLAITVSSINTARKRKGQK